MSERIENRLDDLNKKIDIALNEFDQSIKVFVESAQGMHNRLERLESWIEKQSLEQENL